MVLNPSEESLINVVRTLPAEEARKVLDWARQLGDLGRSRAVEWSDSWSEEDLADATAASLRRFDDREREGRSSPAASRLPKCDLPSCSRQRCIIVIGPTLSLA